MADQGAYSNLVLPGLISRAGLDGRDAGLATEITYGTLRARSRLDAVLERCVDRPLDQLDPAAREIVRLGAYQLLDTRIPPHAAVSSSVDLARRSLGDGPSRFVNAVLRRVGERDAAAWLTEVAPAYDQDPLGHLAIATSHPRWVVSALRDALGGDLAETAAALDADNVRPQVHLVARPGRTTRAAVLEAAGPSARAASFSPYGVVLGAGDPSELAAVRDGSAGVQDEGSQLVALALAAAPLAGSDSRWLDLAAGPGGKAALLAGLAGERGGSLLAVEVSGHRAELTARALAGAANATVIQADGRGPVTAEGKFDRALVDVPCTGLGSLRRRAEARWRRSPRDVAELGPVQRALLDRAVLAVRPGGVVAYATCSPHVAETVAVVNEVVRSGRAEWIDARPTLADLGVPDLGGGPTIQLWPHRHGTDAMFVALLRVSAARH